MLGYPLYPHKIALVNGKEKERKPGLMNANKKEKKERLIFHDNT